FEDVPHEAALRVVAINFTAVLTGAYAALPYLRRTPGSLMFSTSSSSATYGMPQLAVYSATKHAVKGLTEALSVEWQRHGVRVADVLPGRPAGACSGCCRRRAWRKPPGRRTTTRAGRAGAAPGRDGCTGTSRTASSGSTG